MRTFFLSICGLEITGLGLAYFMAAASSASHTTVSQMGPMVNPSALGVVLIGLIVMVTATFSARLSTVS
jgi:hypothetical protein